MEKTYVQQLVEQYMWQDFLIWLGHSAIVFLVVYIFCRWYYKTVHQMMEDRINAENQERLEEERRRQIDREELGL